MLVKIMRKHQALLRVSAMNFGADHHDHHEVHIDRDATWIKFKTNRRLLAVDGMKDTNIPTPKLLDADPFAHTRGKRFFDGDSFFYGDPFYHPIDHEIHATEPQGYMLNDEPNDTRFDLAHPFLVSGCALFGVAFFYFYADLNVTAPAEKILSESMTVQARASQVLQAKSKRIQQLEAQVAALQK